jgi:ribulose-5-phosphate 4-epimerase/fuculose-1-phosphate aldolase
MIRDACEWELRCDLAAAFRLSVRMGLNAGIGNHFSLMLPDSDDHFLVNARGLLFQEITASNLLVIDFAGRVISGGREVRAVTYHIHAPIHRNNPAAKCVVHLHPPNLTSLSMIERGRLALAHHDNLLLNHRVAYDDARPSIEPGRGRSPGRGAGRQDHPNHGKPRRPLGRSDGP